MRRPEEVADSALKLLKQGGAQEAGVNAHALEKREFNVDSGLFSLFRTTYDARLSLTAIRDHRRGVVVSNGFDDEALRVATEECLASTEAAQADEAWELSAEGGGQFVDGVPEAEMSRLFDRTRDLLDDVSRDYPRVLVEQLVVSHNRSRGVYLNSHGTKYKTLSGYYEVDMMFSAHEGEKSSSFHSASLVLSTLDKPFIDQGSLRMNLDAVERGIEPVAMEGKFEGTVLLTPDCLFSFAGALLENFVSDSVILEGTSLWKESLGNRVCDERLTLCMAPRSPDIVCGEHYTAEGFPSEDYCVIREGILEHFMLSRYVANKTGHRRAPNGSFSLLIAPGETELKALIAGISRGVLVGRFSGGQPGVNGDFSGVAKNSFMIEGGAVTHAVSETMISGNLRDMLFDVRGLSRERVKNGMGVLPWLAVDGITVSGK